MRTFMISLCALCATVSAIAASEPQGGERKLTAQSQRDTTFFDTPLYNNASSAGTSPKTAVPYLQIQVGTIGTLPQAFNVLIDTQFAGLILPTTQCSDCSQQSLYDHSLSNTGREISRKLSEFTWNDMGSNLFFDEQKLAGYSFEDTVCFVNSGSEQASLLNSDKQCIERFQFLGSLQKMDLPSGIDGVLGIALQETPAVGHSITKLLVERNKILHVQLGMYTNRAETEGETQTVYSPQLRFGAINAEVIKGKDVASIQWYDYFGGLVAKRIAMGRRELFFGEQLSEGMKVEINAQSPFIIMPKELYAQAMQLLTMTINKAKMQCNKGVCFVEKPCKAMQVPSITILLGETYFEVPRASYLFDGESFDLPSNNCVIGIAVDSTDDPVTKIVLGASFIQNYYFAIDYDKRKLGLAENLGGVGSMTPETHAFSNQSLKLVAYSTAATLFVTVMCSFCLAFIRQKRWQRKYRNMRKINNPNFFINRYDSDENQSELDKGSINQLSTRSFSKREDQSNTGLNEDFAFNAENRRRLTETSLSRSQHGRQLSAFDEFENEMLEQRRIAARHGKRAGASLSFVYFPKTQDQPDDAESQRSSKKSSRSSRKRKTEQSATDSFAANYQ